MKFDIVAEAIHNGHEKWPGIYNELIQEIMEPLNQAKFDNFNVFENMNVS